MLDVTRREVLRRNRALYDNADGAVWRIAVFDAINGGRRYINMGGEKLVLQAAGILDIKADDRVFDLGCGNGDFSARIAGLTGATVTGVEMNPKQAARARAAGAALTRGSLTVIEADAARWKPQAEFRAGFSIDTLMLIADWQAFLGTARRALGPRGGFLASFILGENLTARERRYYWEQDGFVMLPTRAEARNAFHAAGFASLRLMARNRWAMQCLGGIGRALERHRGAIEAEIGRDGWRDWKDVTATYLRAFRSGRLGYALVHARGEGD
jgi:cyclopropane fatty-acyl-phospholipid synthase-like methyltransferase